MDRQLHHAIKGWPHSMEPVDFSDAHISHTIYLHMISQLKAAELRAFHVFLCQRTFHLPPECSLNKTDLKDGMRKKVALLLQLRTIQMRSLLGLVLPLRLMNFTAITSQRRRVWTTKSGIRDVLANHMPWYEFDFVGDGYSFCSMRYTEPEDIQDGRVQIMINDTDANRQTLFAQKSKVPLKNDVSVRCISVLGPVTIPNSVLDEILVQEYWEELVVMVVDMIHERFINMSSSVRVVKSTTSEEMYQTMRKYVKLVGQNVIDRQFGSCEKYLTNYPYNSTLSPVTELLLTKDMTCSIENNTDCDDQLKVHLITVDLPVARCEHTNPSLWSSNKEDMILWVLKRRKLSRSEMLERQWLRLDMCRHELDLVCGEQATQMRENNYLMPQCACSVELAIAVAPNGFRCRKCDKRYVQRICPVTLNIMSHPVRTSVCTHAMAYDFEYIMSQMERESKTVDLEKPLVAPPSLKCPVPGCTAVITGNTLVRCSSKPLSELPLSRVAITIHPVIGGSGSLSMYTEEDEDQGLSDNDADMHFHEQFLQ